MEETAVLIALLAAFDEAWHHQRAQWIGRQVRLCAPVPQVLPAGTAGVIVDLRPDANAPFIVQFEGFHAKVAPLLDKMELIT